MANKIQLTIEADDSKAIAAIRNFTRAAETGFSDIGKSGGILGTQTDSLSGSFAKLGAAILAYFGARQIKQIAIGAVEVASSFEQMEIQLDVLTKGKGIETLQAINEWALEMPVNTREAIDAFKMMQAMGLDPTIEKMQVLVDTSSIFGEEAMPRVARALGQMASLGKLSAEELNQLSEVGINARKYLTEAFGKTVEELQKSKVSIEEIIDVIWKGLEKDFGGASKMAMNTWSGMTTTLISYWEEFQRAVMDEDLFNTLKGSLRILLDEIERFRTEGKFTEWAKDTASAIMLVADSTKYVAMGYQLIEAGWSTLVGSTAAGGAIILGLYRDWVKAIEVVASAGGLWKNKLSKDIEAHRLELEAVVKDLGLTAVTHESMAKDYIANLDKISAGYDTFKKQIDEFATAQKTKVKPALEETGKAQVAVSELTEKELEKRREMESKLAMDIKELTLDAYDFKLAKMDEVVEKAEKVGADEFLILDWYRAESVALEEQKYKEINDLFQAAQDEHNAIMELSGLNEYQIIEARGNQEIESIKKKYAKLIKEVQKDEKKIADLKKMSDEEVAAKENEIEDKLFKTRVERLDNTFSVTAKNFRDIAELGATFGEKGFRMYQAFAIAEALSGAYLGAQEVFTAIVQPSQPWTVPLAYAAAAAALGAGLARAGMISRQEVPSYDEGGISRRPGVYYAGVPEAHIPLKGGRIPVEIKGEREQAPIILENNITLELDGEALSRFISEQIYERTKDGDQIVHTRGITTI